MSANDITVFKLLLIGDSGVGKSSLLMRYVNDIYTGSYISTIGIDFKVKTIELDGQKVQLQIWDTAGQERFHKITSNYYRGAHGILFVFDLTDLKSFNNITFWINEVKKQIDLNSNVKIILVGTKSDAVDLYPEKNKEITNKVIQNFLKHNKMLYVETSAKLNTGVTITFDVIAKELMDIKTNNQVKLAQPNINNINNIKKSCC
jgi:Ras-related protein Rab-1A